MTSLIFSMKWKILLCVDLRQNFIDLIKKGLSHRTLVHKVK